MLLMETNEVQVEGRPRLQVTDVTDHDLFFSQYVYKPIAYYHEYWIIFTVAGIVPNLIALALHILQIIVRSSQHIYRLLIHSKMYSFISKANIDIPKCAFDRECCLSLTASSCWPNKKNTKTEQSTLMLKKRTAVSNLISWI